MLHNHPVLMMVNHDKGASSQNSFHRSTHAVQSIEVQREN
jgi:hypothetical protein